MPWGAANRTGPGSDEALRRRIAELEAELTAERVANAALAATALCRGETSRSAVVRALWPYQARRATVSAAVTNAL
jgi:hypothetical protein